MTSRDQTTPSTRSTHPLRANSVSLQMIKYLFFRSRFVSEQTDDDNDDEAFELLAVLHDLYAEYRLRYSRR